MEKQRRALPRINYAAHALVKSSSRRTVKGIVRDINKEALYLKCKPVFETGENVNLEIVLMGQESELIIRVSASVYRFDDKGVVFKFHKILEWWPVFTHFPFYNLEKKNDK